MPHDIFGVQKRRQSAKFEDKNTAKIWAAQYFSSGFRAELVTEEEQKVNENSHHNLDTMVAKMEYEALGSLDIF